MSMKKETVELFFILSGSFVFFMMGVGMLLLARWSRKKNAELRANGDASQVHALKDLLGRGKQRGAFKAYIADSLAWPEKIMGKTLAVVAIAVCLIFLVFALIALFETI